MENEVKPPSTVSPSVGAAIAKGRQDKKDDQGKSMSQKDLATKINEKPSVVSVACRVGSIGRLVVVFRANAYRDAENTSFLALFFLFLSFPLSHIDDDDDPRPPRQIADYEAGRAIPNVALLAKIERAIGVKLRGDPKTIGAPLPGPGSKKK